VGLKSHFRLDVHHLVPASLLGEGGDQVLSALSASPFTSPFWDWRGSQVVSTRTRVQRGPSEAARCASTSGIASPPFFCFSLSSHLPLEGVARWSLTARIEGPLLYRGASASKKDCLAAPFFLPLLLALWYQGERSRLPSTARIERGPS
jgi:hypothetical protein